MQWLRALLFYSGLVLALSALSLAQSPTGILPFSTHGAGGLDLATTHIFIDIPVRSKVGKIPFGWALHFDSYPGGSAPQFSSSPNFFVSGLAGAGSVNYTRSTVTCSSGKTATKYSNYTFTDSTGAVHAFPGIYYTGTGVGTGSCINRTSLPVISLDGTGYTMANSFTNPSVYDRNGNRVDGDFGSTGLITDPDGNNISVAMCTPPAGFQVCNSYTDTLNQITVTQHLGSHYEYSDTSDQYIYTDANGSNQTYTVNYSPFTWYPSFGCFGNPNPNSATYPTSISTPVGTYTISYEPSPGYSSTSGYTTGRIAQIVYPSGASVSYSYSGGNYGYNCNTQIIPTTTVTVNDNNGHSYVYTYVNSNNSSSPPWNQSGTENYTVTETDPAGNQTVYTFSNLYLTQKKAYQGSASSGSLLFTEMTCYNANFTSCVTPTSAPVLPFSQTDVYTYPGNSSSAALAESVYDSYGNITETKKYDFGAAMPPSGSPVEDTTVSYDGIGASCGTLSGYEHDRPCSATTKNSSGATIGQVNYTYNSTGHPTQTSRLVSGTTYLTSSASYNSNGTMAGFTDANNAVTNFSYGGTGGCNSLLLTSTSLPVSSLSTSQSWNCNGGVLTSTTDQNGQVTNYGYANQNGQADPLWRVLSITDPLGNTIRNTYASLTTYETSLIFNSSTSTVDTLTTLDGLGRPLFRQTRQGPNSSNFDSVQYSYGWATNIGPFTTVTVPYLGTQGQPAPSGTGSTTTQKDALGRTQSVTNSGGASTSYQYTLQDVLVTVGPAPSGENTKRRQLEFDALGRLTSVCEMTSASGSGTCGQTSSQTGYWTKYAYDALGNLLTVTQNAQPGGTQQTRNYQYDAMSRLTSETNPESGTKTYAYDTDSTMCGNGAYTSNGDLVKTVDAAGNCVMRYYDALHRVTDIGNNNQSVNGCKRFRYDNSSGYPGSTKPSGLSNTLGRLIEAATDACNGSNDAIITDEWFSYTARGETSDVYESTPNSGGYYHANQTYWPDGVPNALNGYAGSTLDYSVSSGVDGEGRPYSIYPVSQTVYNPASQPTQLNFSTGDSDSFSYDNNTGRMTQYTFNVGATPQSVVGTLTWNGNGTLSQLAITDPFNAANAQTCGYQYDDLTRITSANCGSAASQTFWYNADGSGAFGNVSKSGSPYSFQPTYSPTTNRMTNISGFTPSYDANGNVLNDNSHTYTWNASGRPLTIDSVNLTYDAFDRMVEQNRSGAYTQIAYAPTGFKMQVMSGQSVVKNFVPLPGGGRAVYNGASLAYIGHRDHLGSIRFASTTSRTMYFDIAYAPFGETYAQSGTTDPSFTGMNPDTVSSDYDFLFREYSTQGRWPSPDPGGLAAVSLGDPQSLNRYAYVRNTPLMLIDPSGMNTVTAACDQKYGSNKCRNNQVPQPCVIGMYWCGALDWDPFDLANIPIVEEEEVIYSVWYSRAQLNDNGDIIGVIIDSVGFHAWRDIQVGTGWAFAGPPNWIPKGLKGPYPPDEGPFIPKPPINPVEPPPEIPVMDPWQETGWGLLAEYLRDFSQTLVDIPLIFVTPCESGAMPQIGHDGNPSCPQTRF